MTPYAVSSCPDESEFPISIKITEEEAVGNHQPLKEISMSLALDYKGLDLVTLQLQYGEVSEFIIPLAYSQKQGKAYASFLISQQYISSLEVFYAYSGKGCDIAVQKLVNT